MIGQVGLGEEAANLLNYEQNTKTRIDIGKQIKLTCSYR